MGIRKTIKNLLGFKSDLASFTVVGVGPGDSSLLTIAAIQAIKKAKLIVFPISSDDRKSSSAEIVKNISNSRKKYPLFFQWQGKNLIQIKSGLVLWI